jgi:DNA-binding NarL/FixJ family response regulator
MFAGTEGAVVVRLVIGDPSTMVQIGYAAVFGSCPDIRIVGQAASATQARRVAQSLSPDVLLLDAALPGGDPFSLGEGLRADAPRIGLVLVGPSHDQMIFRALEERFSAYLPRTGGVDLFTSAVRHAAAAPTAFTAPDLAAALAARRAASAALSTREQEVLHHLYGGFSNAAIAERMRLTESTVRTYIGRLYDKLGVHSRTEALAAAGERGLLH